jgi:hypothetical protein
MVIVCLNVARREKITPENRSSGGRQQMRQHTPASEICSRARVYYAPARASRMEMKLMVDGRDEAEEQGGVRV